MGDINNKMQGLSPEQRALLAKKLAQKKKKAPGSSIPKLDRELGVNHFPLSFVQQRMWFLGQFEQEASTYNGAMALRMKGELNIPALKESLERIVARHEVLRTVYTVIDDQPVQRILPAMDIALPVEDLTHFERDKQEEVIRDKTIEEEKRRIDMENGPLIRFKLLKLSDEETIFIFSMHHILYDGWSMGIFNRELALIYNALVEGKEPELPALKVQYADFAVWQRKLLEGELFDKQMSYWKNKLQGCISLLELPAPRPRPPVHTHEGDCMEFMLRPELTQRLKELSSMYGCTLFMTLMAAFKVLLYRYSNQEDIIVGTPIANRNQSELKDVFGCFVNKLALRTDMSGNPKFTELMEEVKATTLEAYDHQDLPFEKIVEEVQPSRDLSHTPIYQVNFYLEKEEKHTAQLHKVLQEEINIEAGSAKFDLFVVMTDTEEGIQAKWNYYTDLFDASGMEQMIWHFQKILEEVSTNPLQRIEEIPLLSKEEEDKILLEWNQTEQAQDPDKTILDCFYEQVQKTPNAPALIYEDKEITYQEFDEKSSRLANYLKSLGVGAESFVGVFMERSFEMVLSLYAILKAGGAYVPLDPSLPVDRIMFMMEDAKIPIVLTSEKFVGQIPGTAANIIPVDREYTQWKAYPSQMDGSGISSEDACYVIYTSGSTGKPKGVINVHKGMYNRLVWMQEAFPLDEEDRVLQKTPYTFDVSVWEFFWPLMTGASLVIAKPEGHKDSQYLAELIQKKKITTLHFVPSMLRIFLEEPKAARCKSIRRVICSGEALPKALQDRFYDTLDAELFNLYGPTEASIDVTWHRCQRDSCLDTVPIGKPISNTRMYILDSHLQPVPVGVKGELHIAGVGLARGYLNREELTQEKFIQDPFVDDPNERMYKTGDLVYYCEDGTIEYAGRIDFQVKIRGLRIELGEIEAVLGGHPAVEQCVVTVYDEGGERKVITAYIKLDPEQKEKVTDKFLREFLREKLAEYMLPGYFVFLDEIPVSANGKVDRKALPVPTYERDTTQKMVAPSNAIEKKIADIWCTLLKAQEVSVDDNFFEIGGDSLTATLVVRRIDPHLSVIEFFKYPTVRELAQYLKSHHSTKKELLYELTRPIREKDRKVNLVCIPYGGATAITYQALAQAMPEGYSLFSVELPGHDFSNPGEELMSIEALAQKCVGEIKQKIKGSIALYGHCVGGALTVEIARRLEDENLSPLVIFMGGSLPIARLPNKLIEFYYRLFPTHKRGASRSLIERLRVMGGETDVSSPEEREFFVRNLQHDAQEAEDYFTQKINYEKFEPMNAPLIFVGGERDRTTLLFEERYLEWAIFSHHVSYEVIPGAAHYFHKHQAKELAGIIETAVTKPQYEGNEQPKEEGEDQQVEPVSGKLRLPWKFSKFFLVAFGQMISMMGTRLTAFALGVWMFQQTGSTTDYALLFVSTILPGILTLPFSGALADRYNRKKIMIFSNIIASCGTGLLILSFFMGTLSPWQIYVASAIGSVGNALLTPAYLAGVTQLIPKRYFGQANGIVQLSLSSGELIAPLMGGYLLHLIGLGGIFAIDIVTFLFAVVSLAVIRFPDTLFVKREEAFFKEIAGGWQFIARRKSMCALVIFFVITNFLMAIGDVLLAPMVLSFSTPSILGVVSAATGAGLIVGAFIMSLWGGTKRRALGMIGFVCLAGVSIVIKGMRPMTITIITGLFLYAVFVAFIETHWRSLIQVKVGQELQGRVFSINQMLAQIMRPLAFLISGRLADQVFEPAMAEKGAMAELFGGLLGTGPGRGMGLMMALVGGLLLVWGLIGLKYRQLYLIEDILPDAVLPNRIEGTKDDLQKILDEKLEVNLS